MMATRILLATSNPHKLDEIRAVIDWGDADIEWVLLGDLENVQGGEAIEEPVEDQDTFEGNALLKARYYGQASGLACVADDSGLEVDALKGEPGVRSARYSGVSGVSGGGRDVVDSANNAKLLAELEQVPEEKRTARFVCAMAFVDRDADVEMVVRGEVTGRILREARGANGFGYDPLFYVPEHGCTTAQMSAAQKNAISHRGCAARLLWERLKK